MTNSDQRGAFATEMYTGSEVRGWLGGWRSRGLQSESLRLVAQGKLVGCALVGCGHWLRLFEIRIRLLKSDQDE